MGGNPHTASLTATRLSRYSHTHTNRHTHRHMSNLGSSCPPQLKAVEGRTIWTTEQEAASWSGLNHLQHTCTCTHTYKHSQPLLVVLNSFIVQPVSAPYLDFISQQAFAAAAKLRSDCRVDMWDTGMWTAVNQTLGEGKQRLCVWESVYVSF